MRLAVLDFETWGEEPEYALQPWRCPAKAWPTVFVGCVFDTATGEMTHKVLMKFPDAEQIRRWIEDAMLSADYLCAYNAVFDAAWLFALGLQDAVFKYPWIDALVAAKLADNMDRQHQRTMTGKYRADLSYSLKNEVRRELPEFAGYEADVRYDFSIEDVDSPEYLELCKYARIDVLATALLMQRYFQRMTDRQARMLATISASVAPVAAAWVRGIEIDVEHTRQLHKDAVMAKAEIAQRLGLDDSVLSSPKQLSQVIFGAWGIQPVMTTATGQPSTSLDALAAIDDERVRLVMAYSKLSTIVSKFCVGALNSADYNGGTTHPAPQLFSTYTGRITYTSSQGKGKRKCATGIAIHQWSKSPGVREILKPPDGFVLVEFDFAGQEMRLMADFSQDATMVRIFQEKLDGHSLMASRIVGMDYDEFVAQHKNGLMKRERSLGKLANLSLQYRTSAKTFKTRAASMFGIQLTDSEAERIHRTYYETYPGVKQYHNRAIQLAMERGYAETAGGCRVALTDWSERWKAEQTAINYPIQGTGADQKYLAMEMLRPHLAAYNARFAWDLHDGLYFFVPADETPLFLGVGKSVLSNLPFREREWPLQLEYPVDAAWGPRWGKMKEV